MWTSRTALVSLCRLYIGLIAFDCSRIPGSVADMNAVDSCFGFPDYFLCFLFSFVFVFSSFFVSLVFVFSVLFLLF